MPANCITVAVGIKLSFTLSPPGDGNFSFENLLRFLPPFLYTFPARGWKRTNMPIGVQGNRLSFTLSPPGDGNNYIRLSQPRSISSFLYTFPARGWKQTSFVQNPVIDTGVLSFTLSPPGDGSALRSVQRQFSWRRNLQRDGAFPNVLRLTQQAGDNEQ